MSKNSEFVNEKNTFLYIFSLLVIGLLLLPFVSTFNDLLTQLFIKISAYQFIRDYIAPFELKMVGVLLSFLGFHPSVTNEYVILSNGSSKFLGEIIWNCIGWQSLLFFILTVFIGLQGNFKNISKAKAIVFGLCGTVLINIVRIVIVLLLANKVGEATALIFHDYGTLIIAVGWLMFFWWFAYSFILEKKNEV